MLFVNCNMLIAILFYYVMRTLPSFSFDQMAMWVISKLTHWNPHLSQYANVLCWTHAISDILYWGQSNYRQSRKTLHIDKHLNYRKAVQCGSGGLKWQYRWGWLQGWGGWGVEGWGVPVHVKPLPMNPSTSKGCGQVLHSGVMQEKTVTKEKSGRGRMTREMRLVHLMYWRKEWHMPSPKLTLGSGQDVRARV